MEHKVLLQIGKYALIETDTQYIVACGYDRTQPEGGKWNYGLYFTHWCESELKKAHALYEAIEAFRKRTEENYISRYRLEEIATQLKEGLVEDDEIEAMEYFDNVCEMTEGEKEWFGIRGDDQIVVLDRRTSNNQSADNFGDFIFCHNCGRRMLVDIGTQKCPECEENVIDWADENNQEVDESFFSKNDNYILVDVE